MKSQNSTNLPLQFSFANKSINLPAVKPFSEQLREALEQYLFEKKTEPICLFFVNQFWQAAEWDTFWKEVRKLNKPLETSVFAFLPEYFLNYEHSFENDFAKRKFYRDCRYVFVKFLLENYK